MIYIHYYTNIIIYQNDIVFNILFIITRLYWEFYKKKKLIIFNLYFITKPGKQTLKYIKLNF